MCYPFLGHFPSNDGRISVAHVCTAEVCSVQDVPRGGLISSCTHHTFTRFISQSDANAEIVAGGRGQRSGLSCVFCADL